MPSSARLTVHADAAGTLAASEWARALGARLGLSERQIYRLDLCVTELVTNIASYAYVGRSDGLIDLGADAGSDETGLRVQIVDSGIAFDPLDIEPRTAHDRADVPIGGLGIALVRGFADECRYERRGAQNVFSFKIKRGPDATS